jgi:hypothetical protein
MNWSVLPLEFQRENGQHRGFSHEMAAGGGGGLPRRRAGEAVCRGGGRLGAVVADGSAEVADGFSGEGAGVADLGGAGEEAG